MREDNEPLDPELQFSERTEETTQRSSDTNQPSGTEKTPRGPVESPLPIVREFKPFESIAHFQILEKLGEGGFAIVYRARDTNLDRDVALKVPHFREQNQADLAALYLHEARSMARLDHPHIIKVFEATSTPEIPCYLVTQLIDGNHLGVWLEANHGDWLTTAKIFQHLAEALDYAHRCDIVHRDVKPNNILVRRDGFPFIGDFGLAIRDQIDMGTSGGTPSYMSPEQLRREGHRVDGRSDLFSLGIAMYCALTKQKPFDEKSTKKQKIAIQYSNPVHPREIEPSVPAELARICLRLMAKAVCDRYQSGAELATELAEFIDTGETPAEAKSRTENEVASVVPRGLRSFDTDDAKSYLRLLPGPRDRAGLPDDVRFWLSKLDPPDPRDAIAVGLIYGPSGCGKSSLIRAGVMPRLPSTIRQIYLQATPDNTERDLAEAVGTQLADRAGASVDDGLVERVAALRRDSNGARTVILIDQFEQWLFSHPDVERETLTNALRQCDGKQVQCVLMVRDDFWLSVSRLMQALEIPISENQNATLIDLFDAAHAREVLMMFGVAYGKLPKSRTELSKDQQRFLDTAVDSIAVDGRVVSVHLALLALILKDRDWNLNSNLFEDGGTGIGIRFLEETFDAQSAPKRIRRIATVCERVLGKLLPTTGADIKGGMQTEEELRNATNDDELFRDAVAVLDSELHLITPTERTDGGGAAGYQLTHDFLIAPIRQWVELRNRTTKAGRARLRLDEFSSLYKRRPIKQTLPTLGEYLTIRRNVPVASWNPAHQKLMTAAQGYYRTRTVLVLLLVSVLTLVTGFGIVLTRQAMARQKSEDEVAKLVAANLDRTFELAVGARDDALVRAGARSVFQESSNQADRVRAAAINFDIDEEASTFLVEHALRGSVEDTVAIAQHAFSAMDQNEVVRRAWEEASSTPSLRIRAACLMANHETHREQFREPAQMQLLLDLLLAESPVRSELWATAFEDLKPVMLPRLKERLLVRDRKDSLLTGVSLILQFAGDDTELVAELVRCAKPSEFQLLVETLSGAPDAIEILERNWELVTALANPATPWGSPWWVVGNRSPLPGPFPEFALSEQESTEFEAVVRPHAMLMHRLPEVEMRRMIDRASAMGYRVADASPYVDGGERFFFLLAVRDGVPVTFEWDLTASQLRSRNRELREQGWKPDNIEAYRHEDEFRYLCHWIDLGESSTLIDADLYVAVNDAKEGVHKAEGWGLMWNRGMNVPRSSVRVLDGDDILVGSVRWNTLGETPYHDEWDKSLHELAELSEVGLPLSCSGNLQQEGASDTFAKIWWRDFDLDSRELGFQSRAEHLELVSELFDRGYYPVSISSAPLRDSDPTNFQSIWWRASQIQRDVVQARECRNLSLALLALGEDRRVRESLTEAYGDEARGAMLSAFHDFAVSPEWLVDQIVAEDSTVILRRNCLMALSLVEPSAALKQPERLRDFLKEYIKSESDPGIRSAIESVITSWGLGLRLPTPLDVHIELISVAGDRMVAVHPNGAVWIGSSANEPGRNNDKEELRQIVIDHSYAISAREVTVGQFLALFPDHAFASEYASTTDRPAIEISWYDAVKYCRRLSEIEGIAEDEYCYPDVSKIGPDMTVPADAIYRTGYRLPTEAEWEYAARGRGTSGRWFGFDPELLGDHAWTNENSGNRGQPVGRLLPNDYGLFDMLGNVMEWCHGPKYEVSQLAVDAPNADPAAIRFTPGDDRWEFTSRGGCMLYQPNDARASQRNSGSADTRGPYTGFRVVRTIERVSPQN
ncbi:MAG: SUMF1/EgtB/PvdO family nonheme iron enzyme [Planctomycetota bacterium]